MVSLFSLLLTCLFQLGNPLLVTSFGVSLLLSNLFFLLLKLFISSPSIVNAESATRRRRSPTEYSANSGTQLSTYMILPSGSHLKCQVKEFPSTHTYYR
ncbi:unnamed protein product [Protopolystoma xenopodis]|uniref:Uncharacterized protein n=1 Tax=Protopolystoma xenopodis TaxID=117903 RepID=A0A3S5AAN9_9PLAT|nr:unnamed protein product [Protopolystoma xenopodis]